MTIRRGVTRVCILVGRYAIKFPRRHRCGECYPSCASKFALGLYSNHVETARWKRDRDHRMARVIFGCSLVLVMERCQEIAEMSEEMLSRFEGVVSSWDRYPQNFGVTRDGRIVAVDYASWA